MYKKTVRQIMSQHLDEDQVIQSRISLYLGRCITRFAGEYHHPNEQLYRASCSMIRVAEEAFDNVIAVKSYQLKIRIIDGTDPEVEEFLEPERYEIRFDTKTRLKDIFSQVKQCIYSYDFGDNWKHLVILEKVIPDRVNHRPVLLERRQSIEEINQYLSW